MRKIINPKEKLITLITIVLFIAFFYITKIGCPIKELFGIVCPGCGTTRALLSLFTNPLKALYYHPMIWTTPVFPIYLLWDGKPFKSNVINYTVIILVLSGYLLVWILRLIGILPSV